MMAANATLAISIDRTASAARLTLTVHSDKPLDLTFPSAQLYEGVIRDHKGREVYRWSRGRMFAEMMSTVSVTHEKTWEVPLKLKLPAGKYNVEGFLTAGDYHAVTTLEIK